MKKLNLFVIALIVMMIPAFSVHAASVDCSSDHEAEIGGTCYAKLSDAVGAVGTEEETINVVKDVPLDATLDITSGKKVVINLVDGVTISYNNYSFYVHGNSTLKITGTGEVKNTTTTYNSNTSVTIYVQDTSKLTIDKNVTVSGYDVIDMYNCTNGSQLDVYGTLIAKKDVDTLTDGLPTLGAGVTVNRGTDAVGPVVNIHDGAVLTGEGMGMYLATPSKTTVDKATIEGATGISIKAGELTLNGSTVRGTYEYEDPAAWDGGVKTTGAAIQVESNSTYAGQVKIHINDGTYTSEHSYAIQEYVKTGSETSVEEIELKAGTFESNSEDEALSLSDKFIEKFENEPFIDAGTVFTNNGEAAEDVLVYTNNLGISESGKVGTVYKVEITKPKNGKVTTDYANAVEGEEITVTVKADKGYELDKIVAKDAKGEEVKVTNGKFIMPGSNVTIKVTFKKVEANPATGDNLLTYVSLGVISLTGTLGTGLYLKKVNE